MLGRSFLEYQSEYTPEAYGATVSPDIERRLHEGEIWLAYHNSDAVGTISAAIEPLGVHIRGMAIIPEARGLGIAGALLRQVEQFAREHGVSRMHLHTTPFLLRAIRCYERFGFVRSEEPPSDLLGTPLFSMEKELSIETSERATGK